MKRVVTILLLVLVFSGVFIFIEERLSEKYDRKMGLGITGHFVGGSGSLADPYLIGSCIDLQNMKNNLDASYKLVNDIDCINSEGWNQGSGFMSIGYYFKTIMYPFKGKFDGDGFSITNLVINRSLSDAEGLFGLVNGNNCPSGFSSCGEIKNVTLINFRITGNNWVGILSGGVENGLIENVQVVNGSLKGATMVGSLAGKITKTTILKSGSIESLINGTGNDVGGIVGIVSISTPKSTISEAYSINNLVFSGINLGGLIGTNNGNILNSYVYSSQVGTFSPLSPNVPSDNVGGLIGKNQQGATFEKSYFVGRVIGGNRNSLVGGLTSGNLGLCDVSYWDIETDGQTTSACGTGKTTSEMKTQLTFSGWDFANIWRIDSEIHEGYPHLQSLYPPPCIPDWKVTGCFQNETEIISDNNSCGVAYTGEREYCAFNNTKIIGHQFEGGCIGDYDYVLIEDEFINNTKNYSSFVQPLSVEVWKTNSTASFNWNLNTQGVLNLCNVKMKISSFNEGLGYIILNNLSTSGKTVWFNKKMSNSNSVCVKDVLGINSVGDFNVNCNAQDEVLVQCPGNASGYNCNVISSIFGTQFEVGSLSHSGVRETFSSNFSTIPTTNSSSNFTNATTPTTPSACVPQWTCSWGSYDSEGVRYYQCTDLNNCGTTEGRDSKHGDSQIKSDSKIWIYISLGVGILLLLLIVLLFLIKSFNKHQGGYFEQSSHYQSRPSSPPASPPQSPYQGQAVYRPPQQYQR